MKIEPNCVTYIKFSSIHYLTNVDKFYTRLEGEDAIRIILKTQLLSLYRVFQWAQIRSEMIDAT